jgi:hypothetical protein
LPKTIAEALAINYQTRTDFWQKALGKEMNKVNVAWTAANGVARASLNRKGTINDQIPRNTISCDIQCKHGLNPQGEVCRWQSHYGYPGVNYILECCVAQQCATGIPHCRIDVLARDVTNTYLNAKCREKIWFEGGIETGEDKGKVLIVT